METWLKDSSTGVSRPKIETSTLTFCASGLISLIVAGSVANGPSMTVTDSPTSKSTTLTCGLVSFFWVAGTRIRTTSSTVSGDGRDVAPTKPVTPGVLRTAPHDSSLRSIRTRM